MEEFENHMSGTTDADIKEWYGEKYAKDWITETKTMAKADVDKLLTEYKTDVAINLAEETDSIGLSAREWLRENTDRALDPVSEMDDTLAALEQSNADLAPEKVAEEPDVPKGKKLLSVLKWLDPVEEGIAGALTKVGLTGTAATYAIAEATNFIGNLIFEGLRSQADVQMINSKILTGKATDKEVKELNDKIIKNFKSGTQRAAKVSPAANVTDWIGKMLSR